MRFPRAVLSPFGCSLMIGLITAVGLLLVFACVAEQLRVNELVRVDRYLIGIVDSLQTPPLTRGLQLVTYLGARVGTVSFTALCAVWLRIRRERPVIIALPLIALTGSWLLNSFLKNFFQRPRPGGHWLTAAAGYSFPSGHAMISTAVYGLFIYFILTRIHSTGLRLVLASGLALLIVLIGFSRVYLGVHYPSDVLAGFAAGGAWLMGCILSDRIYRTVRA